MRLEKKKKGIRVELFGLEFSIRQLYACPVCDSDEERWLETANKWEAGWPVLGGAYVTGWYCAQDLVTVFDGRSAGGE